MTPEEMETVKAYRKPPRAMIGPLDGTTRTLSMGFGPGEVHHVYQHEGVLHCVTYTEGGDLISHLRGETMHMESLIPMHALNPELCDFAFSMKMAEAGYYPVFADYDHSRSLDDYDGLAGFADDPDLDEVVRPAMSPEPRR